MSGSSATPEFEAVVDLLGDECARRVLVATAGKPRSVPELDELVDVSRQTVYRRLERLREAGLVGERTRPRADGHHETVYEATLSELHVTLTEDGFAFEIEVEPEPDAADELTRLWRQFEE